MNLSIQTIKKLILLIALIVGSTGLQAQVERATVLSNGTLEYEVYSSPNSPFIIGTPENGTAYFVGGAANPLSGQAGGDVLVYEPNEDFIGSDVITITYWNASSIPGIGFHLTKVINISVHAVDAVDDYITTTANGPVVIDILANDIGGFDGLDFYSVNADNDGTATLLSDNTILFEPALDFVGVAKFSYTACSGNGVVSGCDYAIGHILVTDPENIHQDEITIATNKNATIGLYAPIEYGYYPQGTVVDGILETANGTVETAGIYMLNYTPNSGFIGQDQFTIAYDGDPTVDGETNTETGETSGQMISLITYTIDVLDEEETVNFIGVDDRISITIDSEEIEIDVLNNDIGNNLNIANVYQAENGTVTESANNTIIYTPDPGFEGVDVFTYRVCTAGLPKCEFPEVYVTVSNYMPALETYNLTTPIYTPLVIDYDVPITGYTFSIENPPTEGEVEILSGEVDTEINGQAVQGYEMIVYNSYCEGPCEDVFEMKYCVGTDCKLFKINVSVKDNYEGTPQCFVDCVWPGDNNSDGKVNMDDIMALGYCAGEVGIDRNENEGNLNFYGQASENWDNQFVNPGFDIKTIDATGDGLIAASDTSGLSKNFTEYNTVFPTEVIYGNDYTITLIPNSYAYGLGDEVTYSVYVGSATNPVKNLHSVSFEVELDTAINVQNSLSADFKDDSWFLYNAPSIGLVKMTDPEKGTIGVSRALPNAASNGFGLIGTYSFIVRDDLDGIKPSQVLKPRIKFSGKMMDGNGNISAFPEVISEFIIQIPPDYNTTELTARVFPNPTDGFLTIDQVGKNDIQQIVVYSLSGKAVYTSERMEAKSANIDLSGLPNGLYIVDIRTDNGQIAKKINILNQ